ncbi:MAG: hypothetical protein IPL86_19140 [Flavobacteriales bacterium]|nr:hypothetical protein [Flavobacteriales bacterium]
MAAKKKTTAKPAPDVNAQYDAHKKRQAEYQRAISAAGREIGEIPKIVSPDRRAEAKEDLKFHLMTYHPRAFRLGFSKDHEELIEALQHVMLTGGKLVVAMPRGTGKTTIVTRSEGWAILHGHLRYGIYLAATDQKSQKGMIQLRREIENGEVLIEDFPEVCYPVRCLQGLQIDRPGKPVQASRHGWNGERSNWFSPPSQAVRPVDRLWNAAASQVPSHEARSMCCMTEKSSGRITV